MLEQGNLDRALQTAQAVCKEKPEDQEALFLLAVCCRYAKDYQEALSALAQLAELNPGYGRLWQERGHILREQENPQAALENYQRAVRCNPGLIASWAEIAKLAKGKSSHQARGQIAYLQSLPKPLLSAYSMCHEGKLYKAEQICRSFLQQTPHHPEGMRILALIGKELNILDDAQFLLESLVELHPKHSQARFELVEIYKKRQRFLQAYNLAKDIHKLAPEHPVCKILLANQALALGKFDKAIDLYNSALPEAEDKASIHLSLGHALKTAGHQDDAIASYTRAIEHRETFGDAYWSLANLKTYRFSDQQLEKMEQLASTNELDPVDHYHLHFALGKACEDRGDVAQSFHHYEHGNRLRLRETKYDPDLLERDFSAQKATFDTEFAESLANMGCQKADPIFIVGMPRAGSTMMEQILASHPLVDGTLELPDILSMAHRLNGRRRTHETPAYPQNIRDLASHQLNELGEKYLQDTQIHRQGAPFFIDKMPNNFRHIGLIKAILPNAKIIDIRRNPMDCCFSNFKQLFAEGQEFSYSLENVGHYYAQYVGLMDHWQKVFPGQVLHVQYEELIEGFELQLHRILDYCELDFDQQCVDFHNNSRAVRTASSEQVRQPLNRRGINQWKLFEGYLDPLKAALGSSLQNYLPTQLQP